MDSTLASIRTALASPVGVLVAVPSLVALLGIAVALLALAAIRAQSEAVAKDVLVSQAAYVGEDTADRPDAKRLIEQVKALGTP